MEFTLLAAALTGLAAAWFTVTRTGQPEELDRLLGAATAGLLLGRLVAMVAAGVDPLSHPGDILIVRGGVSTVGATAGALAYLLWSARGDLRLLDALAPSAVAGMAGWHAGCLWRGSCLGTASDLPWTWALPGSEVGRHPVELYAALSMALAAWALSRLRPPAGAVALVALAAVAATRLATEPLRPSLTGGPVWWYAAAVALGLTGAAGLRRRGSAGGGPTPSDPVERPGPAAPS